MKSLYEHLTIAVVGFILQKVCKEQKVPSNPCLQTVCEILQLNLLKHLVFS